MEILNPVFALVTPFDDHDHVDVGALKALVNFLQDHGVKTLLVNGTSAEFYALTFTERRQILECVAGHFQGYIISHVSETAYLDVREHVAYSNELADSLLILPSYYLAGPDDQAVCCFMQLALQGAQKPLYLYNFPKHTQYSIPPSVMSNLKKQGLDIRGIKDSRGSIELAREYKTTASDMEVYIGTDSHSVQIHQEGFEGTVTGAGNAVPEYLIQINQALNEGNVEKACEIESEFERWNQFRKSFSGSQIGIVKAALAQRIPDFPIHTRSPLAPISEKMINDVQDYITQLIQDSQILY